MHRQRGVRIALRNAMRGCNREAHPPPPSSRQPPRGQAASAARRCPVNLRAPNPAKVGDRRRETSNVALPTLTILDACAGFGMLAEGVMLGLEALGLAGRVVCHIERDAAAAAALVARMEAEALGGAPVWDDLATFDGLPWRGRVDIACAGLPCQPYSLAGKRTGNTDHRSHGEDGDGPVPHFLRIVGECGPALVFLENVPAWVVGGHFRTVGDELCRMGYEIEDPIFLAAEDVGAPHERERVFILAHRASKRFDWREKRNGDSLQRSPFASSRGDDRGRDSQLALSPSRGRRSGGESSGGNGQPAGGESELADQQRPRREGDRPALTRRGGREQPAECGGELGDTERPQWRAGTAGIESGAGIGRGGLPLFPPGRGDPDNPDHPDWWAWAAVAAVDASRMPRVESALPMVVDGMARADLLRIGGNGVVSVAAAVAFARLLAGVIGLETEVPA